MVLPLAGGVVRSAKGVVNYNKHISLPLPCFAGLLTKQAFEPPRRFAALPLKRGSMLLIINIITKNNMILPLAGGVARNAEGVVE
jgi:hypothetical protein